MAGSNVVGRAEHKADSEVRQLRLEFNKAVADIERLRASVASHVDGTLQSAPGLQIGTTSKKELRHNSAFSVLFKGQNPVTKAAGEVAFTETTHDIGTAKESWFTVSMQRGGTVVLTKGSDADAGLGVKAAAPTAEVVIGWVKILCGAGVAFAAITDDLDKTGLTVTYEDAPVLTAALVTGGTVNA